MLNGVNASKLHVLNERTYLGYQGRGLPCLFNSCNFLNFNLNKLKDGKEFLYSYRKKLELSMLGVSKIKKNLKFFSNINNGGNFEKVF